MKSRMQRGRSELLFLVNYRIYDIQAQETGCVVLKYRCNDIFKTKCCLKPYVPWRGSKRSVYSKQPNRHLLLYIKLLCVIGHQFFNKQLWVFSIQALLCMNNSSRQLVLAGMQLFKLQLIQGKKLFTKKFLKSLLRK